MYYYLKSKVIRSIEFSTSCAIENILTQLESMMNVIRLEVQEDFRTKKALNGTLHKSLVDKASLSILFQMKLSSVSLMGEFKLCLDYE